MTKAATVRTRADRLRAAARALAAAERERRPIPPLTRSIPDLTEDEAYAVARMRVAETGRGSLGYKLGYTSAAMRAQMGIEEPNHGVLLEGGAIAGDMPVPLDRLIHPLVEPEITVLMGRDLGGPGVDGDEAWDAVDMVFPSLEIVDTRYESYSFAALDNIADNSSAACFVLGDGVPRREVAEPGGRAVRLERDGQSVDRGSSSDAMGGPALALAWLANRLARTGFCLRAGQLVMTGGLTRAYPAHAGSRFSASFDGLGSVAAQF